MQKIKNIEFFRFIFALIVCYYHMVINWARLYPTNETFRHLAHVSIGEFCVDLFFIISGYFLYYSILKTNSVFDFAIHKYKRLFPVFGFSLIILSIFKLHFSELILNLLFLQSTSITYLRGINIAAWFVSSLFIVSVFYALIVKSFSKRQGLFLIFICTFLSYSYISRNDGDVVAQVNFYLTNGTIRGLAGIGFGYLTAEILSRNINDIKNYITTSPLLKILISIFEIVSSIGIIYWLIFGKMLLVQRLLIAFVFTGLFICLILKQGVLSKLLDNDFSVFVGKFAYSIYLMQAIYNVYARKNFWINDTFLIEHLYMAIILNLVGYTILGVITYYLVEKPPKTIKNIYNKIFNKGELNA